MDVNEKNIKGQSRTQNQGHFLVNLQWKQEKKREDVLRVKTVLDIPSLSITSTCRDHIMKSKKREKKKNPHIFELHFPATSFTKYCNFCLLATLQCLEELDFFQHTCQWLKTLESLLVSVEKPLSMEWGNSINTEECHKPKLSHVRLIITGTPNRITSGDFSNSSGVANIKQ